MISKKEGYQTCLSIDLRCFDNSKEDYGVQAFLEHLGFLPDRLFNHETYMDQIHTHTGVIDDTFLEPQWVSQRAVPGAQMWTKRQFKGLIDEIRSRGILFYQGCEAAWSCWPEYGEINRCDYLYENLSEAFIVNRNGVTTGEGGMGGLNPLRRFKDGTLYEDRMIRDISRFLIDYECDGFFAADGFAGLVVPLESGCFADDMIDQFTEYTGIQVPAGTTQERADYIWNTLRGEWAEFYSDRWADFHRKLSCAMKAIGKELTVFTPFQMGPADALYMFGIDYRKSYEAGIRSMTLEIMEEITGRRFQIVQGYESVGISNASTAKAVAPDMEIIWTAATCNAPEHWHTLRDQAPIIERECFSLPTIRTLNEKGEEIRALDGFLTIFGIDLSHEEWKWFTRRTDEGFGYPVKRQLGPAIIWSDKILYRHMKDGKAWPLSAGVSKLRYAGIPVTKAVDLANIPFMEKGSSLLLIQPLGLEEPEIDILEKAVQEGMQLIVMGKVENTRLLELLGVERQKNTEFCKRWQYFGKLLKVPDAITGEAEGLQGYRAKTAEVIAELESGEVVLCHRKVGKGKTIYIRRLEETLPPIDTEKTDEEYRSYPVVIETLGASGIKTIREQMESISKMHPDALDQLAASLIQQEDSILPAPHRGQIVAFETREDTQMLLLENSANLMYATTHVVLPYKKKEVKEFPGVKLNGTCGYVFFGDTNPDSIDVSLPPDGAVPVQVTYQSDNS